MAGYAAAMRIERIEIRSGVAARPVGWAPAAADPPVELALIELGGRSPGQHIRERVEDLRVYLGQLTWYLFNAEGWR